VLDNETCRTIISAARKRQIPAFVDPTGRDYAKYHGATALTPNKKEAAEACQVVPQNTEGLLESAAQLRVELELAFMVITRGEEGISLVSASGIEHLPATARQVFDVSGAGDAVISVLAASFVAGLEPKPACHLANLAAGIVVGKVGTASVYREELLRALELEEATKQSNKICRLDDLLVRLQAWRALEQTIVFTNGCFDLLHVGHVTYLEQARKLGGRLIIGLNTDRSIRALKGSTRPIINENDRAHVLAALEAVDAVILFDEDTPLNLINAIHPDILVKGSDYREDQVVGGSEVKSWGGKVELVQLVPYQSTSNIIARIK
jgi:D-beta-D-heptose 7-phosphate kinase/D-beta-D-heptose 1-phosphate adenosyltransferase